jgi:hypothetical protein
VADAEFATAPNTETILDMTNGVKSALVMLNLLMVLIAIVPD